MRHPVTAAAALLAVMLNAGCAAPVQPVADLPDVSVPPPDTAAGTPQWWAVRVYMDFDDDGAVRWHLDALLAERVFAPLVDRLGSALVAWRFHRRAVDDEAGHRLSFGFYADPAIAARVATAVDASALLQALRDAGEVRTVRLPGPGDGAASGIEGTSDPGWPAAVRRAWPHFAMGASRSWLDLVAAVGADAHGAAPPDDGDLPGLIAHYREVNARVNALWQANAQHAWLHHLNAVFGYQPVLLREQRLMVF